MKKRTKMYLIGTASILFIIASINIYNWVMFSKWHPERYLVSQNYINITEQDPLLIKTLDFNLSRFVPSENADYFFKDFFPQQTAGTSLTNYQLEINHDKNTIDFYPKSKTLTCNYSMSEELNESVAFFLDDENIILSDSEINDNDDDIIFIHPDLIDVPANESDYAITEQTLHFIQNDNVSVVILIWFEYTTDEIHPFFFGNSANKEGTLQYFFNLEEEIMMVKFVDYSYSLT